MPADPDPASSIAAAAASGSPAAPDIAVAITAPAWTEALPEAERICIAAATAALEASARPAEVSILLTDDAEVRRLNRDFRGQDKPTNVLSFPSGLAPGLGAADMLGDIVLAFETVAGEAVRDGKTLDAHLRHLVVHGMLHLLGYDHETDEDAAVMEEREVAILAGMGIADPYRASEDERP